MVLTETSHDLGDFVTDTPDDEDENLWSSVPDLTHLAVIVGLSWFRPAAMIVSARQIVTSNPAFQLNYAAVQRHCRAYPHPARYTFAYFGLAFLPHAGIFFIAQQLLRRPLFHYDPHLDSNIPPDSDTDPLDPTPFIPLDATGWTDRPIIAAVQVATNFLAAVCARPFQLGSVRLVTQPLPPDGKYKYTGVIQAIRLTYKEEGSAPFIRGLPLSVAQIMTEELVGRWGNAYKNVLMKWVTRTFPTQNIYLLRLQHTFCVGMDIFLSNMIVSLLMRPLQTIVFRQDVQGSGFEAQIGASLRVTGTLAVAKAIWQQDGFAGFYRGLVNGWRQELWNVPIGMAMDTLLLSQRAYRVKTYADW